MELRPFQEKIIKEIRQEFRNGKKSIVVVAPTGSGKSVLIGAIVQGLFKSKKSTIVLAHRTRLIKQLQDTLLRFMVPSTWVKSGRSSVGNIIKLGMVETIRRRKEKMDEPEYIIVDEAHHTISNQYNDIFNEWPNARKIAFTATPEPTNGAGLGDVFDSMVIGPQMRWLVDNGFLADFDYYGIPSHINFDDVKVNKKRNEYNEKDLEIATRTANLAGDAIESYKKYGQGKTGIIFCVGIKHAEEIAQQFSAAGFPCKPIDGKMNDSTQDRLINELATGEVRFLSSADLIGEGVDIPSIGVVIMLRRTASIIVYLQQAGRALRLKNDNSRAIILDHVGNSKIHGLPDEEKNWTLEGLKKKESNPIKTCNECFRDFHRTEKRSDIVCDNDNCPMTSGDKSRITETVFNIVDAELVKARDPYEWTGGIDIARATGVEWNELIKKANTKEKLDMIRRIRKYSPRWVRYQLQEKGLRNLDKNFIKYKKEQPEKSNRKGNSK